MQQSRLSSLIEAVVSTVIGFAVSVFAGHFVFPHYGVHISLDTNLHITFWFTLISIVRGYVVRRWFNNRIHAMAKRLAERTS